jgi:hypothetical protein
LFGGSSASSFFAASVPRKGRGIMEKNVLKVGSEVIYIDAHRVKHSALVTHVWGQGHADLGGQEPSCNLVYVSGDETKTDPYGRQIERATSVVHKSVQPAGAFCWCRADEVGISD